MEGRSILSRFFARFHSIRAQLTFTSVVLVLILVACVLLASFTLLQYFMRQNNEITQNMVEIVGEGVERRIDTLRKLVSLIRDDAALDRALLDDAGSDTVDRRMSSLYAYGLQHRYLISMRERILDPVYLGNDAQTDNALQLTGFHDFLESGKEERFSAPHQFPFYSPEGDRISFFTKLRDPQRQYEVYGYALFVVSIPTLFENHQDLIRSRLDGVYVVDGRGRLIYDSGQGDQETRDYVSQRFRRPPGADGMEHGGQLFFSAAVPSYSDWRIVGVVDRQTHSRGIYLLMTWVFALGIGGVLLVFLLSNAITMSVSRPVRQINQSMAVFESGQIPPKMPLTPMAGEMSTLVIGFNHMLDNIQAHLHTIVREQEQKKDAEVEALKYQLQSLQHQINPHFLYNTLNIISFLALDGKSAEIRSFNQSLIALLRATLSNTRDTVSVRSEIQFLEAYIDIMAYRYPGQFTTHIQVDDGVLECQIPKLILQPLVENAMIHGIVPGDKAGKIEVLIEDRAPFVYVTVGDDGVGMDPAKLQELLVPRKRFTGIGLSNVNDRLKLCYGQESGLVISSEPSMGTVIMFKIRNSEVRS